MNKESDLIPTVLAFEAAHPSSGPAKNAAIRAQLDMTPSGYYLLLERLTRSERALALDPHVVNRVRRRFDQLAERRHSWMLHTQR